MAQECDVIITNPRPYQGSPNITLIGKRGKVVMVHSKRAVDIVLDGELDPLWFWVDEFIYLDKG